jgi:hypothetical protein
VLGLLSLSMCLWYWLFKNFLIGTVSASIAEVFMAKCPSPCLIVRQAGSNGKISQKLPSQADLCMKTGASLSVTGQNGRQS